jgi:CNT family concentrative nucleoside transporter
MGRLTGLMGIALIFGIAFSLSNNRKRINWRVIGSGFAIQLGLAVFILKVPLGRELFDFLGRMVTKVLGQADKGAAFVFGPLAQSDLLARAFGGDPHQIIFFFKIIPTIIFVAVLVSMAYHWGVMQKIV